ncbi:M23 family metallopeptidase [soil metagenome]
MRTSAVQRLLPPALLHLRRAGEPGLQKPGRVLALATIVFVATAVTACPRDPRHDADPSMGGVADSATAPADATGFPSAASLPPIRAADPPEITAAPDPLLVATPAELAALSAVLDIPVAGVQPSQLRDTFTEARGDRVHEALDILAPRGTPVLSATDGRLLRMFDSSSGGLMVYATDASERFILLYGHLDSYADGLSDGMPLTRGQVIGYVGTTGNAPPEVPHLHFGILRGQPSASWSTGVAVNPYALLVPGRR